MEKAIYYIRNRNFYNLLILLYAVLISYNSFRYILQYNSSRTSPTYSDTPMGWKVGKYVLVFLVLGLVYLLQKPYEKSRRALSIVIFSFILWTFLVNYIWLITFDNVYFDEWESVIWSVSFFPLLFFNDESKRAISNFIPDNFVHIATFIIVSNAYVVANYYLTGRLTALSYENSLLRFGGLWDDPNGFGLFCVYLSYIALEKEKWVFFALLTLCVFFTVSFSSYGIFFVVVFLWVLKADNFKKKNFVAFLIPGITVVVLAVAAFWEKIYKWIIVTVERKSGSLDDHARLDFSYTLFPYLERKYIFHETWYINFFFNYAPLSVFFLLLLFFLFFKLLIKSDKNSSDIFIIAFLLDCCFLPMFAVFPLNVLFFVMLYSIFGIKNRKVYG